MGTYEINPEQIAFRATAESYAVGSFYHGVFRATIAPGAQGNFAWIQDNCDRNQSFLNGEKPSDDYKTAIGQLTTLTGLPRLLLTAGAEEIAKVFSESGALASEDLEEQCHDVFGEAPNSLEAYLIKQAREEIDPRFEFDAHPDRNIATLEVFSHIGPYAVKAFKLFVERGRMAQLYHYMREQAYITDCEARFKDRATQSLPPLAHEQVVNWDDQKQLVSKFLELHGSEIVGDNYADVKVHRTHVDDVTPGSSSLDNSNPTEVSRQVTHLLRDLSKIKDPERY